MTVELLALLDELDAAREKATPGPWEVDGPDGLFASNDTGDLLFDYRDVILVEDHPDGVAQCAADAALIVAAVNNLPGLTAALRAVLTLIDPETGMATGNGYDATRLFDEKDIRHAIADALTPEQAPS